MKGSSQRQLLNIIHLVVWLLHHPEDRLKPEIYTSGAPAKTSGTTEKRPVSLEMLPWTPLEPAIWSRIAWNRLSDEVWP